MKYKLIKVWKNVVMQTARSAHYSGNYVVEARRRKALKEDWPQERVINHIPVQRKNYITKYKHLPFTF